MNIKYLLFQFNVYYITNEVKDWLGTLPFPLPIPRWSLLWIRLSCSRRISEQAVYRFRTIQRTLSSITTVETSTPSSSIMILLKWVVSPHSLVLLTGLLVSFSCELSISPKTSLFSLFKISMHASLLTLQLAVVLPDTFWLLALDGLFLICWIRREFIICFMN